MSTYTKREFTPRDGNAGGYSSRTVFGRVPPIQQRQRRSTCSHQLQQPNKNKIGCGRYPLWSEEYVPLGLTTFFLLTNWLYIDGKRMRKSIQRRTVDYNHSITRWLQVRCLVPLDSITGYVKGNRCLTATSLYFLHANRQLRISKTSETCRFSDQTQTSL